jgi:hypothetical protein
MTSDLPSGEKANAVTAPPVAKLRISLPVAASVS